MALELVLLVLVLDLLEVVSALDAEVLEEPELLEALEALEVPDDAQPASANANTAANTMVTIRFISPPILRISST